MNNDSTSAPVASRLRFARENAGLSQAQVAKKLGIQRPSVSEMEAGRRRVSTDEVIQLASIYKVDVEWLTTGEEITDDQKAKIELVARNLAKLDDETLDNIINLFSSLRSKGE